MMYLPTIYLNCENTLSQKAEERGGSMPRQKRIPRRIRDQSKTSVYSKTMPGTCACRLSEASISNASARVASELDA